jgi:hypothetical protein
MIVHSIITPAILSALIRSDKLTHFYVDPNTDEDGEAELFIEETCATCGNKCRGANPIILKFSPGADLLTKFGLKQSHAIDEIFAGDGGEDECDSCPVMAMGK